MIFHQDKCMKTTKQNTDPYTSIKVPESLRRQLRILAASREQFIYQLIASLLLKEFNLISSLADEIES
jgi:hypothetical protein